MKIVKCEIWKDRDCNECHSQNDVKEVHLGANVIALCIGFRDKLYEMLDEEDGI